MLFQFPSISVTRSSVPCLQQLFFCPPFPFQIYENTDTMLIELNHQHFCSDKTYRRNQEAKIKDYFYL